MRRAPKGGYGFETKQAFREAVWSQIQSRSRLTGQQTAQVFLMPSSEGLEIDEALARGFNESQLHVCDVNPAIVASLRRKYPEINTYGVSTSRAHRRIAANSVSLLPASLDYTSNVNEMLCSQVAMCSYANVWEHGAVVVINVLRGREPGQSAPFFAELGGEVPLWFAHAASRLTDDSRQLLVSDLWRCLFISASLVSHFAELRTLRIYTSANGQSFLTMAFQVWRPEGIARELASAEHRKELRWQRAARIAALDHAIFAALGAVDWSSGIKMPGAIAVRGPKRVATRRISNDAVTRGVRVLRTEFPNAASSLDMDAQTKGIAVMITAHGHPEILSILNDGYDEITLEGR